MGDDKSTSEHPRTRPALGDISNRVRKKGLLVIHGQPGHQFRDGVSHNVDDTDKDLHFVHKLCQGVENVVKERCGSKRNIDDCNKGKKACISLPSTCIEINSLRRNVAPSISEVPFEAKRTNLVDVMMSREDKFSKAFIDGTNSFIGAGDETEVCGASSIRKVIGPRPLVGPESNVKEIFADNLVLSQEGSVGFSIIPTSQGSNTFALERCTRVDEKCSSLQSDMIKTCSCPFCVKAAYIWSDLVYLDVKGRISALQKSQKEANLLAFRNSTATKGSDTVHGPKSSVKCSKLESDLTGQWRSLFHYMENTLASEASKLESSLLKLKDLREDCKTNMEK